MKKAQVLCHFAVWLGMVALMPAQASGFESHQHEIVGGEAVTDLSSYEYKHTVRLLVKGVLNGENVPDAIKGLKMSWRCSGALLSKRLVLSAAHCFPRSIAVSDPVNGQIVRAEMTSLNAEVFFKTDTRSDRPWGTKSEKILVHPGFRDDWTSKVANVWNPEESIHDIALVKLSEDAPAEKEAVLPLSLQEPQLVNGEEGVMAGYGRDVTDEQISIPKLRRVAVPLREPLRNQSEWYAGRGDLLKAGKVDRPGGGCVGDSGGPLFVQRGKFVRLAGVIVRGPDQQNGGCEAAVTIVTSVAKYTQWISEKSKELAAP